MNDDLFANLPPVKSPRLLWMEKHGITVTTRASGHDQTWWASRDDGKAILAVSKHSEQDALVMLARKLNLKLWNE